MKILVFDPYEPVALVLRRVLEKAGHEVISAQNMNDILFKIENPDQPADPPFDLIIAPLEPEYQNFDGPGLAFRGNEFKQLILIYEHDIKVLLTSLYLDDPEIKALLKKPFDLGEVRKIIEFAEKSKNQKDFENRLKLQKQIRNNYPQ